MTMAYRSDEPRLTAADVRAQQFLRGGLGRRGYDEGDVDAFLEQVERELEKCANEATAGRAEIARLRRRFLEEGRGGEVGAGAEEAHAMAVAIVSEAHVHVERMVGDAQAYSARLTEEAMARYEATLAEAGRVLADAKAQATAAALAAMEEPVPDPAGGALIASRASDAYGRTYTSVHVDAALPLCEALNQLLRNMHALAHAGSPVPGNADRVAAPAAQDG